MKLCECGCGRPTHIARYSHARVGYIKGQPQRFLKGHRRRPDTVHWETLDIDGPDGCWHWTGSTGSAGYGQFGADRQRLLAHRAFYEAFVGPIPEGLHIDHLCRNRRCVNPNHLEPVSCAENLRRGAGAKLSLEQVREIRERTESGRQLGREYGVSSSLIYRIRKNERWREEATK